MEKGKFSQPRPDRDEERQIEEAFRMVTESGKPSRTPRQPFRPAVPEETLYKTAQELLTEVPPVSEPELPIEEAIALEIEQTYSQDILPQFPPEQEAEELELPEEEPLPEGDFLDTAMAFCLEHRKWILAGLFCTALVMLLIVGITFALGGSSTEETILDNVIIAGVNVGGMTKNEAIRTVEQATAQTYSRQDMVVSIAGMELRLSPKDTRAVLDVKSAVNEAYNYGRTGTQEEQEAAYKNSLRGNHTIGLLPHLQLDKEYIRNTLDAYAGDTGSTLTQVSYGLEGAYPALDAQRFDPGAAQTLVLTMGTPGIRFDADRVYDQILDAYSLHIFQVNVDRVEPAVLPEPVDLVAIYAEFFVAPVDSRIDLQTFQVIPGSYGYDFDLEAAQNLVDQAQYGQVVRIPMRFLEPQLMDENILFRDVLGQCQISAVSNRHLHNIRIACEAIQGRVLQPGDSFSFLSAVGQPTAAKGYQEADIYTVNGQEPVLGGGISQLSSALYYTALLADLEIVSRSCHSVPVSYLDYGMDADVSWNGTDLQLRNNTGYPIRIDLQLTGSTLTVRLLGTDDRDYSVTLSYTISQVHEPVTEYRDFPYDNDQGYRDGDVIQEGMNGYSVKTYKHKYSRTTGQLVSKDFITNSRYITRNTLVARVAPEETTIPEATVPETLAPEPTVPETTLPPETLPPPPAMEEVYPQDPSAEETMPELLDVPEEAA